MLIIWSALQVGLQDHTLDHHSPTGLERDPKGSSSCSQLHAKGCHDSLEFDLRFAGVCLEASEGNQSGDTTVWAWVKEVWDDWPWVDGCRTTPQHPECKYWASHAHESCPHWQHVVWWIIRSLSKQHSTSHDQLQTLQWWFQRWTTSTMSWPALHGTGHTFHPFVLPPLLPRRPATGTIHTLISQRCTASPWVSRISFFFLLMLTL